MAVKDELEKLQQEVSALDAEWKEVWQQFQENDQRQQAAFNVSDDDEECNRIGGNISDFAH